FTQKEQAGWDKAWAVHAKRFAAEITAAKKQATPLKPKLSAGELQELAFGAYVGLVREQGSSTATPATIRVRQTALARIFAIASTGPAAARSARPILTQALGDPNQPVRMQAFEHLLSLGFDKTMLAADALEAGHTDLGVKGLELLTAGTTGTDSDAVLERVLLSRTDDLALEAAKLLAKTKGQVPVAAVSLDAVSEKLRQQSVAWLAAEYDKNAEAQKYLRKAVESRYRHVRQAAAMELATKKDQAAFDVLAAMLREATEKGQQGRVIAALGTLGDSRAVDVFLDRIESDPTGTALVGDLFEAAAVFYNPACVDRLADMALRKGEWFAHAYNAVLIVSGYTQIAPSPDDEAAFAAAEAKQHPRLPAVLAKAFDLLIRTGKIVDRPAVLAHAKASRGPEVDEPLATMAASPHDEVRRKALEMIGWRLRKRGGPPDALLKALRHKDPTTQFMAAEGLARGGRSEGLPVLLSSLEYLDDVQMRRNAVLALGELADPRAVDVLLKFAGENGHALQEPAAEALGHLRISPRGDEIGKLLERLAKSPMDGVAQQALVGLRWFDSPAGWTLIRAAARSNNWKTRQTAVEQLGHSADPASRDAVLERLRKDNDNDVVNAAFDAAVRQFGPDSLEPCYAAVETPHEKNFTAMGEAGTDVLKALRERGDTLRLLQTLPQTTGNGFAAVEGILMARPTPPDDVMTKALAGDNPWMVKAAARMIARAAAPSTPVRKAVEAAIGKWWATWRTRRDLMLRRIGQHDQEATAKAVTLAEVALEELLWPAARFGFAEKTLAD
ncbi:HEAT repeat domain-containing protein, partial [Zavarzinella formosa]|uniref:HEAT repeat domain-containing protein n=1 Tax=Zavarzinella formosa TaxID=360055 RepID=UPI0005928240